MKVDFKYDIGDYVYALLPVIHGDRVEVNGGIIDRRIDEYGNRWYTVDCGPVDGVMEFYERTLELDDYYY